MMGWQYRTNWSELSASMRRLAVNWPEDWFSLTSWPRSLQTQLYPKRRTIPVAWRPPRLFPQHLFHVVLGQGATEEKTLHLVAAQQSQQLRLRLRLHALGHHL